MMRLRNIIILEQHIPQLIPPVFVSVLLLLSLLLLYILLVEDLLF